MSTIVTSPDDSPLDAAPSTTLPLTPPPGGGSGRPAAAASPPVDPTELTTWTQKLMITMSVMFGAFMAVMDISVVNVSLPHMMGSFGQDLSSITWVATSYSIAEIIMITMSGWWSTLLGRKRLFMISFGIFTVGSMLCGTATTFEQILAYRVLQGIGGGTLIPVSQAILRETFPKRMQGMAMAFYGMGVVLAPAIGPVFGGWLTDHYGWAWIFYINVPVSLLGMFLVHTFVHDPPYLRRGVKNVDWLGIALLAITLTTTQIVLERGQAENWFESRYIIFGTALAISSLLGLIAWELHIDEPIINLRLLRNIPLSVGAIMGGAFGVALIGSTFVIPQFTQELLGYPAFEAGLVLLPRALTLLIFMPLVGILYHQIDARYLVFFGTLVMGLSYWELSHLSLNAGIWTLVPMLITMGVGMPFCFISLSTLSLSSIPREDMTEASSLYTLARSVGGNIGYALVATLVARGRQVNFTQLSAHIEATSPAYLGYKEHLASTFIQAGMNPAAVEPSVFASTVHLVHRQAAMMAYNDTSYIMGGLFMCTIPFIFLMPSGSHKHK